MLNKLLSIVFLYFLICTNSVSNEPVLSQVVPRIPSENRCQLAKAYITQSLLPVEENLSNYMILGNCALKKNKLNVAFEYWNKAALLGDESSMANIGRISSLNASSADERIFGWKVLAKLGEQNVKYAYLSKLFTALSLLAYSEFYEREYDRDIHETVAQLFIQAIELEKQFTNESLMITKYLLSADYFTNIKLKEATFNRIATAAKEANPHFCYMHEALVRDIYKLPKNKFLLFS